MVVDVESVVPGITKLFTENAPLTCKSLLTIVVAPAGSSVKFPLLLEIV